MSCARSVEVARLSFRSTMQISSDEIQLLLAVSVVIITSDLDPKPEFQTLASVV